MTTKNLEEAIADQLAKEISKEIDNEIMLSLLVDSGWVEVKLLYKDRDHVVDVMTWIGDHFKKNQWTRLNNSFVFREKKDAEWFILRWV